ncbi:hypothetical protein Hanom_Chr11g01004491 [Helianthus anomalus]
MARVLTILIVLCIIIVRSDKKAALYRTRTLFSVESQNYFDWQTVGLIYSFETRQPRPIKRILSSTDEPEGL